MPVEAQLQADVDGLRLRTHAASARPATGASLAVAALLLWAVPGGLPTPRLLPWLLALAVVVCWRMALPLLHRRTRTALPPARPDAERAWQAGLLRHYRLSLAGHGLVWGCSAWLPVSLADAQLQAVLVIVLVGLVVGAMTLTLFDQTAAWLFAGGVLLPLAARLLLQGAPLSLPTAVTLGMGALLLAVLGVAGWRTNRARHALAAVRRAERDSTQREREAQQQLQLRRLAADEQQRILALVLERTEQGFWFIDNDLRTTDANPAMCRMLGLPRAQLLGRCIFDFADAANRAVFSHHAAQRAAGQAGGYEITLTRADGGRVHCFNNATPVLDAQGRKTGALGLFSDISASVAAQAALIAARDEAERARGDAEAANRAKSDFLSRMSHELRTPLNAILGFAQLLQTDPQEPPSPRQHQRLDALLHGGQHLLALINDVLDVARIEAGHLQLTLGPVDLGRLVADGLALVQPMALARGVHLAAPVGVLAGGPLVTADATRLQQVLLNLLSNAIKFNRDGGQVLLRLLVLPGGVRLEVADQGAGITAAQLPRLFQAFERLDQHGAVEGTGIGLALSRSLVKQMHGDIGVSSTPGAGSVFWVQLPGAAPAAARLAPPAAARPAVVAAAPPRDVLYIEDNEVNQLLMEGMLAQRPAIRLRMAGLPEAGLAMALAQPPDLLLLDIQLPGIDGFEVLRRLRLLPALAHTPVVAVSANAMPGDLAQARAAGFADYLTKPLHMPQLLALVDRLLA